MTQVEDTSNDESAHEYYAPGNLTTAVVDAVDAQDMNPHRKSTLNSGSPSSKHI